LKKRKAVAAQKQRVLVLMHPDLIPSEPVTLKGEELEAAPWKTEWDVLRTLRDLGHETLAVGVHDDLSPIRSGVFEHKPHVVFNLLEGFANQPSFDQNVVAYLELLDVRYTGCNSRGLLLARDKAIAKQLLTYHRLPVPAFAIVPKGRKVRRPRRLAFPLIVKSLTMDSSIGISQASVVETDAKLAERVAFIHDSVGTDALVERYVEGRELYVGVLGNDRLQTLPVWELKFANMPEETRNIATERLKFSMEYQKKHGITSGPAEDLPPELTRRIQTVCKRVYRHLKLNGFARIDLRLEPTGRVFVIEANPNPQLSRDEDFSQSARKAGMGYGELIQKIVNLGLAYEPLRYA
jgi:D-alanine-D-alanine ligase